MRILAISDTHKKIDNALWVLENKGPFDMIFHMGDHSRDAMDIHYVTEIPVIMVNGNCDYNNDVPLDRTLELAGNKILLTHGHHHQVKLGLSPLKHLMKKETYDLICYGHTHVQKVWDKGRGIIINPGSISEPRDGAPGYVIFNIEDFGEITYNFHRMGEDT